MELREDIKYYAKLAQHKLGLVAGQLELTSKCFQKCAMCESWRDDLSGVVRGTWSLNNVKNLFNQLAQFKTFEHLSLTGGDPQHWPDLDELLRWYDWHREKGVFKFSLQLNTALTQDPDYELWRRTFRDVRVSLDGVVKRTYQLMRGDGKTNPMDILFRLEKLNHPGAATNTCVTTRNIEEVPLIVETLNTYVPNLRKAMFLAVIGSRDTAKTEAEVAFWESYGKLKELNRVSKVPLSFQEDVAGVRAFLQSPAAAEVPCYAGNITFHIKANGDWYPCCLTGGEAIATYSDFKLGNLNEHSVQYIHHKIQQRAETPKDYCAGKPCRDICQWKQLSLNLATHQAASNQLAMP